MADSSDAQAIIDIATMAGVPQRIDGYPDVAFFNVPAGGAVAAQGLERFRPVPLRKRGTAHLFTAESFAEFVNRHETDSTVVYADVDKAAVVGVLNDDGTEAGWRDHRGVLVLRPTPAWNRWTSRNGKALTQEEFAELVEEGVGDIAEPSGAEMLEIAATFQAKTAVDFKSAVVLESGQRQLVWEETVSAKAGQAGQLTVPKQFALALAPWEGAVAYRVVARLRYRIRDGHLTVAFVLDRPDDVRRAAFDDIVDTIGGQVAAPVLRGAPPDPLATGPAEMHPAR